MDWKAIYRQKLTTAQEAVKHIKSGDRVSLSHAVGEPTHIIEAMVANREAYRNVEITHMISMGQSKYAQPGMEPYFRHNSLFVGGTTRKTVRDGHGDFTPCYFSEIPNLWHRTMPLDVAVIHVSRPMNMATAAWGCRLTTQNTR